MLRHEGVDVGGVLGANAGNRLTDRAVRILRTLDCGNSGTTTRLMAGILAGSPLSARLVGDASLSRRPMGRVARPLSAIRIQVRVGFMTDTSMAVTARLANYHARLRVSQT